MPLTASAGAVRLGPHSRRHEPPPYRAPTICASIERLRAARPDIAFTSDFIVGFPGETDEDFDADPWPCRRGRLRRRLLVQIFAAARHAGGRAWPIRLPEAVKAERLQRCRRLIERQHARLQRRMRRPHVRCPVREAGAACPARSVGRSPYLQPVQVMAPADLIGHIAPVIDRRHRIEQSFRRPREQSITPARNAASLAAAEA